MRKGEKGRMVVLWRWFEDESGEERASIRYFNVWNVAQCEGIQAPVAPVRTFAPIEAAENIIANLPATHAPIRHGVSAACYVPALDEIRMPSRESFVSAEAYYGVLWHELTHSTGALARLARRGVTEPTRFADHAYSEEELVAEMGSAFLANECGILPATLENSAAYLRSWVRVLKGDSRLVVRAAGQAQKAADWLLNRSEPRCGGGEGFVGHPRPARDERSRRSSSSCRAPEVRPAAGALAPAPPPSKKHAGTTAGRRHLRSAGRVAANETPAALRRRAPRTLRGRASRSPVVPPLARLLGLPSAAAFDGREVACGGVFEALLLPPVFLRTEGEVEGSR